MKNHELSPGLYTVQVEDVTSWCMIIGDRARMFDPFSHFSAMIEWVDKMGWDAGDFAVHSEDTLVLLLPFEMMIGGCYESS